MFGGKIVEGEQRIAILGEAQERLVVFAAVGFLRGHRRRLRRPSSSPPYRAAPLGLGVQALEQLVECCASVLEQRLRALVSRSV